MKERATWISFLKRNNLSDDGLKTEWIFFNYKETKRNACVHMTMHDFIFSSKRDARWSRHFIFWSCWFLYLSCTQLRNQSPDEIGMNHFIIYQLGVSANRVLLQMLFCYPFIYLIMPAYFKKRRFKEFAIVTVTFIVAMYWITYFTIIYISGPTAVHPFSSISRMSCL
jgi:hypothetical protein